MPARSTLAVDLAVMAGAGLFFAAIGPFDTNLAPPGPRTAYWLAVMLIGALVVHGVERVVIRLGGAATGLSSAGLTALAATPVQTGVVVASGAIFLGYHPDASLYFAILSGVLVVTGAAIALMRLARRALLQPALDPPVSKRTGASSGPGSGEPAPPPAKLALRLPAKLRDAGLIALQAEDHYVRVHTCAGSDLILMRLSDAAALAEARVPGHRLHRSWWASAAAIESLQFSRGTGEARLTGGLTAPVSRTYYPALRDAGWF
jgi:hypothetical protein